MQFRLQDGESFMDEDARLTEGIAVEGLRVLDSGWDAQ